MVGVHEQYFQTKSQLVTGDTQIRASSQHPGGEWGCKNKGFKETHRWGPMKKSSNKHTVCYVQPKTSNKHIEIGGSGVYKQSLITDMQRDTQTKC